MGSRSHAEGNTEPCQVEGLPEANFFFFFLINLPKERRVSKYFHHMEGKR